MKETFSKQHSSRALSSGHTQPNREPGGNPSVREAVEMSQKVWNGGRQTLIMTSPHRHGQ